MCASVVVVYSRPLQARERVGGGGFVQRVSAPANVLLAEVGGF